jgi:cell wall-associated NlpC family hydrolase
MTFSAPGLVAPDEILRAEALVLELIGRPWRAGADGPEAFDCYGLARHVRQQLFGDDLPAVPRPSFMLPLKDVREAFASAAQPLGWRRLGEDEPRQHGAVVLMGSAVVPGHAGVFLAIGPGRVLHADERYGVCFEDLATLRLRGFARFRFYAKG